jgi:hypothetical protein
MENITWNSLLTGFYWVIGFILVLCIIAWLISEKGRINAERAKQYDDLYDKIQKMLSWTATEKVYYLILEELGKLQKLEYKNEEKTEILKDEFFKKYKKISDEILSQDEFSIEMTFKKN